MPLWGGCGRYCRVARRSSSTGPACRCSTGVASARTTENSGDRPRRPASVRRHGAQALVLDLALPRHPARGRGIGPARCCQSQSMCSRPRTIVRLSDDRHSRRDESPRSRRKFQEMLLPAQNTGHLAPELTVNNRTPGHEQRCAQARSDGAPDRRCHDAPPPGALGLVRAPALRSTDRDDRAFRYLPRIHQYSRPAGSAQDHRHRLI